MIPKFRWSLLSGLLVLLILIVGGCVGYVTQYKLRRREMEEFEERIAQENVAPEIIPAVLSDERTPTSRTLMLIVSPQEFDAIRQEALQNPPSYDDVSHLDLPPYEIAVTRA